MVSEIVVYTKPGCVQCDWTMRKMTEFGVAYREIDVKLHPEAIGVLIGMGYRTLPVVVVAPDRHWAGFKIDKLKGLAHR